MEINTPSDIGFLPLFFMVLEVEIGEGVCVNVSKERGGDDANQIPPIMFTHPSRLNKYFCASISLFGCVFFFTAFYLLLIITVARA